SLQLFARGFAICRREIETRGVDARKRGEHLTQETAVAAGEIDVFDAPLILPAERARKLAERDAAHGVSGAAEQHFDLRVIELRTVLAEPAAGLVVEVLQIIGGIAL